MYPPFFDCSRRIDLETPRGTGSTTSSRRRVAKTSLLLALQDEEDLSPITGYRQIFSGSCETFQTSKRSPFAAHSRRHSHVFTTLAPPVLHLTQDVQTRRRHEVHEVVDFRVTTEAAGSMEVFYFKCLRSLDCRLFYGRRPTETRHPRGVLFWSGQVDSSPCELSSSLKTFYFRCSKPIISRRERAPPF